MNECHATLLSLVLLSAALLAAQPLPLSTPEAQGLSQERLKRLHQTFQQITEEGKRAGAITMIVRNGKIADWQVYGYRDREAGFRWRRIRFSTSGR